MAKNVKISVISMSPPHTSYEEFLEIKLQEMQAFLQTELNKVLPDKPDLIVLPEMCDFFRAFTAEQNKVYYKVRGNRILDFLSQVARENHCYIAYCAVRYLPEEKELPFRNSTQIIGRDGKVVGIYDKNHLVPLELENREVAYGTEAPVFQLDFGKVACAICFDLNYQELLNKYAAQQPDLIIFSSHYHGGIAQSNWAYQCRAFFAGSVTEDESRILNPFGEPVAATVSGDDALTHTVNMDYAICHLDNNEEKIQAAKEKYGENLSVYDPGHIGCVMLSYEGTDKTVKDILEEFQIATADAYFDACRAHRNAHI